MRGVRNQHLDGHVPLLWHHWGLMTTVFQRKKQRPTRVETNVVVGKHWLSEFGQIPVGKKSLNIEFRSNSISGSEHFWTNIAIVKRRQQQCPEVSTFAARSTDERDLQFVTYPSVTLMSFFVSKVAALNHARGTAHAEASAEASLARRRRIEIQKIKNKKNKERGEKKTLSSHSSMFCNQGPLWQRAVDNLIDKLMWLVIDGRSAAFSGGLLASGCRCGGWWERPQSQTAAVQSSS